ncbi:cytochrome P450 [Lasiosphaeria hispida]|uniref:Cytochrome P450 n=1 Tax=Lasiosphaeria hispida TaxID=260671 RepID=A0AAJ0HCI6_9PEZI|nr:cytochrome P450 [Lasiosphaeria hispida]
MPIQISVHFSDLVGVVRVGGVAVLVLLSVSWVVGAVRSWNRMRHIPGPALARWSSAWMVRKLSSGRFHEHMCEAMEEYGPLVRIGPNELLCSDPEVLRRMSAARSLYTKGQFYETGRIIPGCDNVVTQRDEVKHKALRAQMSNAYRESSNSGFEDGVDRQILQLIALIDHKYISEPGLLRPMDLAAKAQFFTLDVISDVSFGAPFGFLTEDTDLFQYNEINASAIPIMNMLQAMPWLSNVVYRWPLRLALPSDGDKVGFGRLMGVAKSYVDERLLQGSKPKRDMLQAFIDSGMSYDDLIQHMFVQIVAGSITTASAIRHTLLALISTPTAYSTLQSEIDLATPASSPIITAAEAHTLPYLQAVVLEGLRMWPPTTGLGCKQVPRGGDVICGFPVPEGTQVGHNFSGMMRARGIWGEDAGVFRPERWLEMDEGERGELEGVVELDFGSGRYQCLGKRIALVELDKVFFELLRRYNFALVDPQKPIKSQSGVFWLGSDLWVRVTKR